MASSVLKYFISMVFIFSTIYTMAFYYYDATSAQVGVDVPDGAISGFNVTDLKASGFGVLVGNSFIDWFAETLSWMPPFALVKGLLIVLIPEELYDPINMLFLRPIGWIGTWITTEWVINKIRGSSES